MEVEDDMMDELVLGYLRDMGYWDATEAFVKDSPHVTRTSKVRPELRKLNLRFIVEDYFVIKRRSEEFSGKWKSEIDVTSTDSVSRIVLEMTKLLGSSKAKDVRPAIEPLVVTQVKNNQERLVRITGTDEKGRRTLVPETEHFTPVVGSSSNFAGWSQKDAVKNAPATPSGHNKRRKPEKVAKRNPRDSVPEPPSPSGEVVAKACKYFLEHPSEQEKLAESINSAITSAVPAGSSKGPCSKVSSGDGSMPADVNMLLHSPGKDDLVGAIAEKALDPLHTAWEDLFGGDVRDVETPQKSAKKPTASAGTTIYAHMSSPPRTSPASTSSNPANSERSLMPPPASPLVRLDSSQVEFSPCSSRTANNTVPLQPGCSSSMANASTMTIGNTSSKPARTPGAGAVVPSTPEAPKNEPLKSIFSPGTPIGFSPQQATIVTSSASAMSHLRPLVSTTTAPTSMATLTSFALPNNTSATILVPLGYFSAHSNPGVRQMSPLTFTVKAPPPQPPATQVQRQPQQQHVQRQPQQRESQQQRVEPQKQQKREDPLVRGQQLPGQPQMGQQSSQHGQNQQQRSQPTKPQPEKQIKGVRGKKPTETAVDKQSTAQAPGPLPSALKKKPLLGLMKAQMEMLKLRSSEKPKQSLAVPVEAPEEHRTEPQEAVEKENLTEKVGEPVKDQLQVNKKPHPEEDGLPWSPPLALQRAVARPPNRRSLSTPRRDPAHVRALDFTSPRSLNAKTMSSLSFDIDGTPPSSSEELATKVLIRKKLDTAKAGLVFSPVQEEKGVPIVDIVSPAPKLDGELPEPFPMRDEATQTAEADFRGGTRCCGVKNCSPSEQSFPPSPEQIDGLDCVSRGVLTDVHRFHKPISLEVAAHLATPSKSTAMAVHQPNGASIFSPISTPDLRIAKGMADSPGKLFQALSEYPSGILHSVGLMPPPPAVPVRVDSPGFESDCSQDQKTLQELQRLEPVSNPEPVSVPEEKPSQPSARPSRSRKEPAVEKETRTTRNSRSGGRDDKETKSKQEVKPIGRQGRSAGRKKKGKEEQNPAADGPSPLDIILPHNPPQENKQEGAQLRRSSRNKPPTPKQKVDAKEPKKQKPARQSRNAKSDERDEAKDAPETSHITPLALSLQTVLEDSVTTPFPLDMKSPPREKQTILARVSKADLALSEDSSEESFEKKPEEKEMVDKLEEEASKPFKKRRIVEEEPQTVSTSKKTEEKPGKAAPAATEATSLQAPGPSSLSRKRPISEIALPPQRPSTSSGVSQAVRRSPRKRAKLGPAAATTVVPKDMKTVRLRESMKACFGSDYDTCDESSPMKSALSSPGASMLSMDASQSCSNFSDVAQKPPRRIIPTYLGPSQIQSPMKSPPKPQPPNTPAKPKLPVQSLAAELGLELSDSSSSSPSSPSSSSTTSSETTLESSDSDSEDSSSDSSDSSSSDSESTEDKSSSTAPSNAVVVEKDGKVLAEKDASKEKPQREPTDRRTSFQGILSETKEGPRETVVPPPVPIAQNKEPEQQQAEPAPVIQEQAEDEEGEEPSVAEIQKRLSAATFDIWSQFIGEEKEEKKAERNEIQGRDEDKKKSKREAGKAEEDGEIVSEDETEEVDGRDARPDNLHRNDRPKHDTASDLSRRLYEAEARRSYGVPRMFIAGRGPPPPPPPPRPPSSTSSSYSSSRRHHRRESPERRREDEGDRRWTSPRRNDGRRGREMRERSRSPSFRVPSSSRGRNSYRNMDSRSDRRNERRK